MKYLICLALALPLFVACGADESSAKEAPAPAKTSSDVTATIHYVCTGGEHTKDLAATEGVPECCGAPMKPKP